jgi:hypothetical protein
MAFYSATKNEILSVAGKWMEVETLSSVKLARFKRSKATSLLSYVEYRPDTSIAILGKTGHTKGGAHTRGGG